jgi:hypothetical protein
MEHLLSVIVIWLATNFGLPANFEHPRIQFLSAGQMLSLRYHGLLSKAVVQGARPPEALHAHSLEAAQLVALYSDADSVIYLPNGWHGRTPAELSILVHEMAHHLQSRGSLTYQCPQEREKLAYKAQDAWLRLFGSTLESEFQIDPMTLLVSTSCVMAEPP